MIFYIIWVTAIGSEGKRSCPGNTTENQSVVVVRYSTFRLGCGTLTLSHPILSTFLYHNNKIGILFR